MSHCICHQNHLLHSWCENDDHFNHLRRPHPLAQARVACSRSLLLLLSRALCLRLGRAVARLSSLLFRRLCCSPGICFRRLCHWRHAWLPGRHNFLCFFWSHVRSLSIEMSCLPHPHPLLCRYTLIFLPMAVVCVCAAYVVSRRPSFSYLAPPKSPLRLSSRSSPANGALCELHAPESRSLLIGVISAVFFLLCMSCTTFLTWQFASYAANGYLLPGTGYPVNANYTNNYFQGNYDPLNFALLKWNPTGPVIVQLWPDVVMFTAFMLVLFLVGFSARLSPTVSASLSKEIQIPKLGSVSCGAFLLLLWSATLCGMWAYYWSVLYCDSDCMSDSTKSRFQCCRLFQETRKCTVTLDDPTYGCGTREQQANSGAPRLPAA